jgi:hypothetical protein
VTGIQRHYNKAGSRGTNKDLHVSVAIRSQDRDSITFANTQIMQQTRQPTATLVELTKGKAIGSVNHSRFLRRLLKRSF